MFVCFVVGFLNAGDLLYYGGVEWLNISDFLGKIKKGLELHAMCFVFKSAVVFLCKERLRQKKKLMVGSKPKLYLKMQYSYTFLQQGVSSKNATNEVEIIRYQVLIPVTEVQVRASSAKDMDSHFLWELIHLRSQLQRRSEKVYVLSNSTADFRNAFLKTIRQIIRESVRNMSIPMKGMGSMSSIVDLPPHPRGSGGNSQTLERPKQQIVSFYNVALTFERIVISRFLLRLSCKAHRRWGKPRNRRTRNVIRPATSTMITCKAVRRRRTCRRRLSPDSVSAVRLLVIQV